MSAYGYKCATCGPFLSRHLTRRACPNCRQDGVELFCVKCNAWRKGAGHYIEGKCTGKSHEECMRGSVVLYAVGHTTVRRFEMDRMATIGDFLQAARGKATQNYRAMAPQWSRKGFRCDEECLESMEVGFYFREAQFVVLEHRYDSGLAGVISGANTGLAYAMAFVRGLGMYRIGFCVVMVFLLCIILL